MNMTTINRDIEKPAPTATGPLLPTRELSSPVADGAVLSSNISHLQEPFTKQSASVFSRLRAHVLTNVDLRYTYIPLLVCCFVSGLNDSSAYAAWGTFVSMQTGNTIFLALGASNQPSSPRYVWLKALIAILIFLIACFILPRIQRLFSTSGTTRLGLFISFFIQALALFTAAAFVQSSISPESLGLTTPFAMNPNDPYFTELAPMGLMAFQAGGQITVSRMLGFGEIPTIVLSSAYCDLVSDTKVFTLKNGKRDRRIASVVALLIGAICGGWMTRSIGRLESVLWLGAGIKVVMALAWLGWTGENKDEVDRKKGA